MVITLVKNLWWNPGDDEKIYSVYQEQMEDILLQERQIVLVRMMFLIRTDIYLVIRCGPKLSGGSLGDRRLTLVQPNIRWRLRYSWGNFDFRSRG
ncbi:MAG: hypothetical protein IPK08_20035 [Bacteroidetes bacterium]|nr:hypothetical protein [Bacteroidota bacterium]